MKKTILLFCFMLAGAPLGFSLKEVVVEPASVQEQPPDRYTVIAPVVNRTDKPREVTLRAQIFLFDLVSPKGDRPVAILRKDTTVVLKARERRKVRVRLINEGSLPKERLRMEIQMRLRRQRIWHS